MIIYDRLGVPSRVAHQLEALGLRPFGLVSEHSQRQKVTDTLVTRAGFESVGWRKGRRQAHERRGQHFVIFSHPSSPGGTGAGESQR